MSIIVDIVLIIFLALMFLWGYKKGFLDRAWWLVDIALIVALGLLLVPTVSDALTVHTGLYGALKNALSVMEEEAERKAALIVDIIVWVGIGIIVIILMAILKAVLKKLRQYAFFKIVDGILGGIYLVVITFAVLMVLGLLVGTFTNYSAIAKAHDFCADSYVFRYIFGANPFESFAAEHFPLGTWVAKLFAK